MCRGYLSVCCIAFCSSVDVSIQIDKGNQLRENQVYAKIQLKTPIYLWAFQFIKKQAESRDSNTIRSWIAIIEGRSPGGSKIRLGK